MTPATKPLEGAPGLQEYERELTGARIHARAVADRLKGIREAVEVCHGNIRNAAGNEPLDEDQMATLGGHLADLLDQRDRTKLEAKAARKQEDAAWEAFKAAGGAP